MRILSIDVAVRTLAVCVVSCDPATEPVDCEHFHCSWAGLTIEHWSTVDILKHHGCKAKKVSSVPCERLMHYMMNYFDSLLQTVRAPLHYVLIERQHGRNKLSRYLSMCMYTYFFQRYGCSLQHGKRGIKVIRPVASPVIQFIHAKHKLSVLPVVDMSGTNSYDVRKELARDKADYIITKCHSADPVRFQDAHTFWTGIRRKDHKDDPADALLQALWFVESKIKFPSAAIKG